MIYRIPLERQLITFSTKIDLKIQKKKKQQPPMTEKGK